MAMCNVKVTIGKPAELSAQEIQGLQDQAPVKDYGEGAWDVWLMSKEYRNMSGAKRNEIVGYSTIPDVLANLTPAKFIKAMEKYLEEEKIVHLGDEISHKGLNGEEHYIVTEVDDSGFYTAIGKCGTIHFYKLAINAGEVTKTGEHFDSIPFEYIRS